VRLFALNMVLALVWAMATGIITMGTLAFGFLIGMLVLHFVGPVLGDERYALRFVLAIGLLVFFLKELVLSSIRVAIDVIKPRLTMRPAVISVPLELESHAEITLLANLISLTPGTLSVDVSDDGSTLYVHAMYGEDADALRTGIKSDFERRIREVFR
jgi:multicomponent Na+:H+ antiporter subunit E